MTEELPTFPDSSATVTPLLAVDDLTRSMSFWVGQVGAAVEVEWETLPSCGSVLGGCIWPSPVIRLPIARSGWFRRAAVSSMPTARWVIQVSDCHAVVTALLERGVTFLGPAAEPPWGGEVRALARDPDGHLLEITSPS